MSLRIITKKELRAIVPYSPQHILRLETTGKFPRRIRIGERRVGWRLSDVLAWIEARAADATAPAAPGSSLQQVAAASGR